jgi:hypothetical protein
MPKKSAAETENEKLRRRVEALENELARNKAAQSDRAPAGRA